MHLTAGELKFLIWATQPTRPEVFQTDKSHSREVALRLVKRGYVDRLEPVNGRNTFRLTPAGRAALEMATR